MHKGWALGRGRRRRVLHVLRVVTVGVEEEQSALEVRAQTCYLMSAATLEEI